MQVRSLWVTHRGQKKRLDEMRQRFAVEEGDAIMMLNIHDAYRDARNQSKFANNNMLNNRALLRAGDVRAQLKRHLDRLGVITNSSCGEDTIPIRRAIAAGFFANAARWLRAVAAPSGSVFNSLRASSARARARELRVHPSSAIFNSRPTCVVYCSAVRTDREYMRDVTVVEADWLRELAPHLARAAPRARLAPRRAHAPIITPRTAARRPTLCTHTHRSIDIIASTRLVGGRQQRPFVFPNEAAARAPSTSTTTPRAPEPNPTKKNRRRFAASRAVSPASPLSRAPRSPLAAAGVRRSVPRLARCPTLQRAPRPSVSPIAVADRELGGRAIRAVFRADAGDDARARRGAAPPRASGYKPSRHDPAIDFSHGE